MLRKFTKSILVAAVLAIGLSACTSREEAVSKVQQEGVVDFQDGWKLYLENTNDPEMIRIVQQDGPTYVYSENDKPLFIYTCGDVNQPAEVLFNTELGSAKGLARPGQGFSPILADTRTGNGTVFGIRVVYGLHPDAFTNEVDGKSRQQIEEENTLLRDQRIDYLPISGAKRIGISTDSLVKDTVPFKLAEGLEYTAYSPRREWLDLYGKVNQTHPGAYSTSDVAMESLYHGLPNHTYRAYKLPAIQNPGLYNGSVCNFTWDKFDPRDIKSSTNTAAVLTDKQISDQEAKYSAQYNKIGGDIVNSLSKREEERIRSLNAGVNEDVTPLEQEDVPAAHPQLNTEPEVKDPNFQVNNDGTVTRSYSGSYSQIYASKSARGDWAPAGNPDAAQGRSMYALCHVSGNQNACKRLENRCGKDEYVKTESDMYFCLGADETETTGQ